MTEHPEDQPNGGAQQPSEVAGPTPLVSETPLDATVGADAPSDDTQAITPSSEAEATPDAPSVESPEATENTPEESSLREQSSALLDRLVETYPAAFFPFTTRQVKPLKIGIHKDLEPSLREWGYSPAVLKIALSRYTRARRYQVALLKEPKRLDLQGQEAGEVSDENRQIAQTRIDEFNEKRKQQQAAIKAAKAASTTPSNTPNPGRPRPRNEPRKPQRNRKARDPRAASRPNSGEASTTRDQAPQPTTPSSVTANTHSPPPRSRPPRQKKPSGPREPTAEKLAALAAKFNSRS